MDANKGRFDTSSTDPVDPGAPPPFFAGLHNLPEHLAALKEFGAYYIATKIDALKLTLRNVGIFAALSVVGLIAMGAVIVTSVVLLLVGIADGISRIFGPGHEWIGQIIVGVVVLGGMAAAIVLGLRWITKTSRAALVKKYENRQHQQRVNLGRDVRGREADTSERREHEQSANRG